MTPAAKSSASLVADLRGKVTHEITSPIGAPPAPAIDTPFGAVLAHLDSSSSTGLDLAGLFNAFLASLSGQVSGETPEGTARVNRFIGELSESLRKGLDERSKAPGVTPESRAKADKHARAGLQFIQENKLAEAEDALRQAVVLNPAKADWHGNLGVVLGRRGRVADAEACFRTALALDPTSATAHANVGTACAQRGKLADAEIHFRQAIFLNPADPNLHEHLGNTLLGMRNPVEAKACFEQALKLRPTGVDAKFRMACLLKEEEKLAEAESALREVLQQKSDHLDALNTLGIVLEDAGKHAESEAIYRVALKIKPAAPDILSNLGVALSSMDRHEEAVGVYRESLRIKPDGIAAHNNIGNALRQLGRLDDAAHHLREAIRFKPDYAEAHNNLGIVLIQQGETKIGAELYGKALELRRGDYPEARLNRALAWLSEGDYERGWDEYEFRWKGKAAKLRDYPKPVWDGSDPKGKTLYLYPEQGLGDSIQFLRYADLAAKRGARVIAEVPRPLFELARTCPGIAEVFPSGAEPPPFDFHAPLLNLPRLLGTRKVEDIPGPQPYFTPDPARVEHWRRELAGVEGLRVGISWQGNPQHKGDRTRSIRLDRFAPLAAVPGVSLISLQKGFGREQLGDLNARFEVLDMGARTSDESMADVAALVSALDLVICVDTSLGHLAGALGRLVWVMISFAPDWRWLKAGSETRWYPSMRLYRQAAPGEWEPVFARIAADLRGHREMTPVRESFPTIAGAAERVQVARALLENGRIEQAVPRLEEAAKDSDSVDVRNWLGIAYARQRRFGDAVRTFQELVAAHPDSMAGRCNLATALADASQPAEAESAWREVLRRKPDHPDAHIKLANLLRQLNRREEAIAVHRERLAVKPDDAGSLNSLGILLEEFGRMAEAEQAYREARKHAPDAPDIVNNLGVALAAQGKLDEALACYEEAVRRRHTSPVFHNNLGNALRQVGRTPDAIRHLREAIRLKPDYAEAHNNLAIALAHAGYAEEAILAYQRALELRPSYAEAHNNLGVLLNDIRSPAEALPAFNKALELKPDYPEARLNRALAWLSEGDYERGWDEYEFRWNGKGARIREYPRPLWRGEDLAGKTLFLHPEQGLGDTIQFLRYARLAADRGARVIAEVQPSLIDLAKTCRGIDTLIPCGQEPPAFDYHAPLLGLPRLFGTRRPEDIPGPYPYLSADPARVAYWRTELNGTDGFRVGIAWQGNPQHRGDHTRSVRLERFGILAAVPGVRLISVQKGHGRDQLDTVKGRFELTDLGGRTADDSIADAAALIAALDLVVTVDTAVAHMAGALGKPVWILVSYNADWRWMRDRPDTQWYPSARLFRQRKPGDWDGVFEELRRAVGDQIAVADPAVTAAARTA
jgi:tetratricopeptide (TPR) repeat protein